MLKPLLSFIILTFLHSSLINAKYLKTLNCTSSSPDVCGPFAKCIEEFPFEELNESSYCECDTFAYGQPPNCKSKCKEDCKSNEYCDVVKKVCVIKCEEHEDCKADEYCRFYEGDCRKGCRNHESCKDDEFCDPYEKVCKIGCRGDEFCKIDEYCDFFKNVCTKGCRDDESCKDDEYCDSFNDRLCKKGCREWPGNCKKGEYCNSDNHECEKGCEHDTHCESNEICNLSNKTCYSYCYESPCGNNSICTIVDNIRHCSCMTGYSPLSGVGCEVESIFDMTSVIDGNYNCQSYCGHKSLCAVENNKVVCFCSEDNGYNPFVNCNFEIPAAVPPPPAIGTACIAALCG